MALRFGLVLCFLVLAAAQFGPGDDDFESHMGQQAKPCVSKDDPTKTVAYMTTWSSKDGCQMCDCAFDGSWNCKTVQKNQCPKCPNGSRVVPGVCCSECTTDKEAPCDIGGTPVQSGQAVNPPDPCQTDCTCNNGLVTCRGSRLPCPQVDCKEGSSPVKPPGKCCNVCETRPEVTCEGKYKVGDSWKTDNCRTCTCGAGGSTQCRSTGCAHELCPPFAVIPAGATECCDQCDTTKTWCAVPKSGREWTFYRDGETVPSDDKCVTKVCKDNAIVTTSAECPASCPTGEVLKPTTTGCCKQECAKDTTKPSTGTGSGKLQCPPSKFEPAGAAPHDVGTTWQANSGDSCAQCKCTLDGEYAGTSCTVHNCAATEDALRCPPAERESREGQCCKSCKAGSWCRYGNPVQYAKEGEKVQSLSTACTTATCTGGQLSYSSVKCETPADCVSGTIFQQIDPKIAGQGCCQGKCVKVSESTCIVNGTTYQHGAKVATGSPCKDCTCDAGSTRCSIMTPLQEADCGSMEYVPPKQGECTGQCLFPKLQEECVHEGATYPLDAKIPSKLPCERCYCSRVGVRCPVVTCNCTAPFVPRGNDTHCCVECVDPNAPPTVTGCDEVVDGKPVRYAVSAEIPTADPCKQCFCMRTGKECYKKCADMPACNADQARVKSECGCFICKSCAAPYRLPGADGCVWNCAEGTEPNLDRLVCECKKGYVFANKDSLGRFVCKPQQETPPTDPTAANPCLNTKCGATQKCEVTFPQCTASNCVPVAKCVDTATAPSRPICAMEAINQCATPPPSGGMDLASGCKWLNQNAECALGANCNDVAKFYCGQIGDMPPNSCPSPTCADKRIKDSTCNDDVFQSCLSSKPRGDNCVSVTNTIECASQSRCYDNVESLCAKLKPNNWCPSAYTKCIADSALQDITPKQLAAFDAIYEAGRHPFQRQLPSSRPALLLTAAVVLTGTLLVGVLVVLVARRRRGVATDYQELQAQA